MAAMVVEEAGAAVEVAEGLEAAELAGKDTKVIRDCLLKGWCHG